MTSINKIDFFNFVKDDPTEAINNPLAGTRYYLEAFNKYVNGRKKFKFIKFNFPAFFFSYVWLFYRKMYLYGFIIFLLELSLKELTSSPLFGVPMQIFGELFVRLFLGFFGTTLYLRFSEKKITKDKKYSGTSLISVVTAVGLIFVWTLMANWFSIT